MAELEKRHGGDKKKSKKVACQLCDKTLLHANLKAHYQTVHHVATAQLARFEV